MKKVLGEIKAEVTVLLRTENILKSRADNLDDFMKGLEKQAGISGYTKVQDQLQMVSENNEVLNNQKDKTLQEITQIVQQIEAEAKEKKINLAPIIKKLRGLRTKLADMEAKYNEKKKHYENIVQNLD